MHGQYHNNTVELKHSNIGSTRGSRYKLTLAHMHYDMRKYFFINSATSVLESFPDQVVSIESVNRFKNALDKFWHNQPVKFDWKINLLGAGNRVRINSTQSRIEYLINVDMLRQT